MGKKEQEILDFLKDKSEGVWKSEIIDKFSWAKRYDGVVSKRLQNLQKKGLIVIKSEINPESGRYKQRVYLNS
mgnify:FL=1